MPPGLSPAAVRFRWPFILKMATLYVWNMSEVLKEENRTIFRNVFVLNPESLNE